MDQELIEIEMGIPRKAEYPDILYSGGVGPCITVGLWHPSQRVGYMIHDHDLDTGLPALLTDVERECKNLSDMQVCAVGASLYVDLPDTKEDMQEMLKGSKDFVEKTLADKFSKIQFHWLEPGHEAELYLDTMMGKFLLKVYDSRSNPNEAAEQTLDFNFKERRD